MLPVDIISVKFQRGFNITSNLQLGFRKWQSPRACQPFFPSRDRQCHHHTAGTIHAPDCSLATVSLSNSPLATGQQTTDSAQGRDLICPLGQPRSLAEQTVGIETRHDRPRRQEIVRKTFALTFLRIGLFRGRRLYRRFLRVANSVHACQVTL